MVAIRLTNNLKLEIEKNGDECKIVNIFRKEENKDDLKYKVLEKVMIC